MQRGRISLSDNERERYNRQIILPQWGEEGQEKIKGSTVFIAGAGGLGSSAAIYLAAAGVGCMRVCDFGKVERSNLNRQILYSDKDIGKSKVQSAMNTIERINPNVHCVGLFQTIESKNISELVLNSDIIIDCLDNFETRYVLNEFAVRTGTPFVHGGVYGMAGQLTFIHPPETPCLRCIFPEAPPPETFPIVGAAPGVVGCLEALEALKYLGGLKGLLKNKLLVWEGDFATFEEISLEKDSSCPICSKRH